MYLQGFISELGFSDSERTQLCCDNRGAQLLAWNHTFHAMSKHIDVRHHFVRDILREFHLEIKYLSSEGMPADFLTKGLTKDKHYKCLDLVPSWRQETNKRSNRHYSRGGVLEFYFIIHKRL